MALVDGVCDSRLEFVPVLDEHNNLKHINADCKAGLVCVCVCGRYWHVRRNTTPSLRFELLLHYYFPLCCLLS